MKNIVNIILITLWCLSPLGAYAQGTHWSCDERAFQYDMTAYIALVDDSGTPLNLSVYEVAAFIGSECRGTTKVVTLPESGTSYGYLRIRSNVASGETVTFKAYNKSQGKEIIVEAENVTFESNAVKGLPSAPLLLKIKQTFLIGDVNSDGRITIADVAALVNIILGKDKSVPYQYNHIAADVNGDSSITETDVTALVDIILGK